MVQKEVTMLFVMLIFNTLIKPTTAGQGACGVCSVPERQTCADGRVSGNSCDSPLVDADGSPSCHGSSCNVDDFKFHGNCCKDPYGTCCGCNKEEASYWNLNYVNPDKQTEKPRCELCPSGWIGREKIYGPRSTLVKKVSNSEYNCEVLQGPSDNQAALTLCFRETAVEQTKIVDPIETDAKCLQCDEKQGYYNDELGQIACKSCAGNEGKELDLKKGYGQRLPDDENFALKCFEMTQTAWDEILAADKSGNENNNNPPFTFEETREQACSVPCIQCHEGRYLNSETNLCQDCDTGKSQPARGQPDCNECETGKFQHEPRQSECKSCDAGKFYNSATLACEGCAPGKEVGNNGCVGCDLGQYSDANVDKCTGCPHGYYQNGSTSTNCIACPLGFAAIDMVRLCFPKKNYYYFILCSNFFLLLNTKTSGFTQMQWMRIW